jgi:hypothetical protein
VIEIRDVDVTAQAQLREWYDEALGYRQLETLLEYHRTL